MNPEILEIVKFDCTPARWRVKVRADGKDVQVDCTTIALLSYKAFQAACFDQTHVILPEIDDASWKKAVKDATPSIEVKRPSGDGFLYALESLVYEAAHEATPEVLAAGAGRDSQGTVFFRLDVFRDALRKIRQPDEPRKVKDRLKELGWKTVVRRFGRKTVRVWSKEGAFQEQRS